MQLDIYSLENKKNRVGYYLLHALIGVMVWMTAQLLYISYFAIKSVFIDAMQFMLMTIVSYIVCNYLMLRGNNKKREYIKRGLLIVGVTSLTGILVGIILRVV